MKKKQRGLQENFKGRSFRTKIQEVGEMVAMLWWNPLSDWICIPGRVAASGCSSLFREFIFRFKDA